MIILISETYIKVHNLIKITKKCPTKKERTHNTASKVKKIWKEKRECKAKTSNQGNKKVSLARNK
jgi:hypothetical protein